MYGIDRKNLFGGDREEEFGVAEKVLSVALTVITILLATLLFVRTVWLKPYPVDGSSMLPTVKTGDWVLADRLAAPKMFDVVIVDTPDKVLIKRVVGLEGDVVCYDANGHLYEVETDAGGNERKTFSGKTLYRLKDDPHGNFAVKPVIEYFATYDRAKKAGVSLTDRDILVEKGEYEGKVGRLKGVDGYKAEVEILSESGIVGAEISLGDFSVLLDEKIIKKELEKDEVFCLGDNRGNSRDSRDYGAFKKKNIVGVVHQIVLDNREKLGWLYRYL